LLAESGADLQRALDLAQQAKAQRPDDPSASDTLGWVLYHRGASSAAVSYLREAVAGLEPGSPEIGLTRHHLALAYEANEQKQQAIEALELTLSELSERQERTRSGGAKTADPEWASPAREMLARLKSSS
jgi:tetratricopeptide (TPR) repeat protein